MKKINFEFVCFQNAFKDDNFQPGLKVVIVNLTSTASKENLILS